MIPLTIKDIDNITEIIMNRDKNHPYSEVQASEKIIKYISNKLQDKNINKELTSMLKKDMEKNLLKGWDDIYGQMFSKRGFIDKSDWDSFWNDRLEQESLVSESTGVNHNTP